ncbi:hemerythrin family protein [Desulfovibrio sulfodismutans]|uniref:Hemerythrin family protein n=1 Tax=Desulfolutivibrio sulfodismutans TaxID=63561 RepID=A0A7K3NQI3_9BACT|nr:bacteriohemerythrin [Desulfolutivibrio sulfodismutans]NDY58347.1 hemerythrin family protein [Desulfolutivibrio sulfodismutans]QLA12724.1 bacteriohemerythrin [Desulfolutivibrio sulfodismutans DSM 3696]
MPLLEWNDDLSTHVHDIDAQHRRLVEMTNRLHDGMLREESTGFLQGILDEMGRYAVEHFGTEEGYMDAHGYPDSAAHKSEHRDFTEKVRTIAADCSGGRCALSMDILNFLCGWLVTHISGSDQKLGAFLRAHGVDAAGD